LSKSLLIYHDISLKENLLLRDFLKKKSKTHLESLVLSKENIDNFFGNAPNKDNFIIIKCALAIGIFGLSRISELTNLCFDDVISNGAAFEVTIKESKTDCKKKWFKF
jgi:hypothetical protein